MNTKKYAFCVAEDINLGVAYIMSYLKSQGHEVKLFFDPCQFKRGYMRVPFLAKMFDISKRNIKKIKEYAPDEIWFSCVTATYGWALDMALCAKTELPDCHIVFGGVHPTLVPEEVCKHDFIDEVVVGCGIEYLGGEFEPDKIFPDRKAFLAQLPPEHTRTQIFMTSFGCPFNCSFCGNEQLRKIKKHRLIRRKVDPCIEELKQMKEAGMTSVLFVDDIFTSEKVWLEAFLTKYKNEIGLPFTCFVHPRFVDKEVADVLAAAGCEMAWMGIQTGAEQLRKDILNRPETNEEIITACEHIKGAGMKLMVDHIFGIPHENNMTNDISYTLYKHIKADVVNCYNLLYFPKSKMIEHAIKAGVMTPVQAAAINKGEGVTYQLGDKVNEYYDKYVKGMIALPLGGLEYELLPEWFIKLIVHLKAGRGFIVKVMIQNELYFTWGRLWKR